MKNVNIWLTLSALLVSFSINLASASQEDEIVVTIPSPTNSLELSSGTMCAQLSSEDVEYAKAKAREAYQAAKDAGVEKPIIVQLPGGTFQLTEPIVLGPEDSGDAQRPIIWRGSSIEPGTQISGGEFLYGHLERASGYRSLVIANAVGTCN